MTIRTSAVSTTARWSPWSKGQEAEQQLFSRAFSERWYDPNFGISQAKRLRVDSMSTDQQIVPGVFISSSGQATVDSSLADVLFDLSLKLEELTKLPVDVEHVLAAVVLASRKGVLTPETPLSTNDPALVELLITPVRTVFTDFDGRVGQDD